MWGCCGDTKLPIFSWGAIDCFVCLLHQAKILRENYFASSDPHHGIQFIPSDILSGKTSGILFGILFEILSGISSGILSGISSDISSDIKSGISIWHSIWHVF